MNKHTVEYIAKRLAVTPETATAVREIIYNLKSPNKYESVRQWARQCYHQPGIHDRKMQALNEILGGYGVEASDNDMNPAFEYINMGDSYVPTVIFSAEKQYQFECLGDN